MKKGSVLFLIAICLRVGNGSRPRPRRRVHPQNYWIANAFFSINKSPSRNSRRLFTKFNKNNKSQILVSRQKNSLTLRPLELFVRGDEKKCTETREIQLRLVIIYHASLKQKSCKWTNKNNELLNYERGNIFCIDIFSSAEGWHVKEGLMVNDVKLPIVKAILTQSKGAWADTFCINRSTVRDFLLMPFWLIFSFLKKNFFSQSKFAGWIVEKWVGVGSRVESKFIVKFVFKFMILSMFNKIIKKRFLLAPTNLIKIGILNSF